MPTESQTPPVLTVEMTALASGGSCVGTIQSPEEYAGKKAFIPFTAPGELVEAFLYSWVAGQLSAAVRLVPLGPTQAQGLHLALAPLLAQRARELAMADPVSLWTGGVGAGLAQLGHSELYSRLFRS